MILADVTPFGIGGKQAEEVLEKIEISANKNMLPFDERKPMDPSGIRIGTPAITTRGFTEDATKKLGQIMLDVLKNSTDAAVLEKATKEVRELADAFPLYPEYGQLGG